VTFFRLRDLHLAHFAWSDIAASKFHFEEKAHLALPGIAGASEERLDVFNEDWSAREEGDGNRPARRPHEGGRALPEAHTGQDSGPSRRGRHLTQGARARRVLPLRLDPAARGIGNPDARNARRALSGTAWFDHEWGPGALPEGAVGWDWFGIQLDDRSELMLYGCG
jgi:predicted secreted hydrolase